MYFVTLICLLSVGFATLSSAGLCDSLNATPAEDVFGQQSNRKASNLQPKKSKRALLVCSSSEDCFSLANQPFCVNTRTGNFHDAELTTGNAYTGNYVLADGREGNLYFGPFPVPQDSSTNPGLAVTVTKGGMFVIPTPSANNAEKTEQQPIDAPTVVKNFPTQATDTPKTAMTDGSGETTDGVTVPGGAGRAELGWGVGMWIMVTMLSASMVGAFML